VLRFKERIYYILIITFLACSLGYVLFGGDEEYVTNYNLKIDDLEIKIDSLHGINSNLNTKIEGLNSQISSLDGKLSSQDSKITKLKKQINEKVNDVDFLNDDELEMFFTNRYRQYIDSIRKTDR
tara:strand:+ start:2012 stop:2386 length:375 start_codon:yes stop_codon:yes gene_type:complete